MSNSDPGILWPSEKCTKRKHRFLHAACNSAKQTSVFSIKSQGHLCHPEKMTPYNIVTKNKCVEKHIYRQVFSNILQRNRHIAACYQPWHRHKRFSTQCTVSTIGHLQKKMTPYSIPPVHLKQYTVPVNRLSAKAAGGKIPTCKAAGSKIPTCKAASDKIPGSEAAGGKINKQKAAGGKIHRANHRRVRAEWGRTWMRQRTHHNATISQEHVARIRKTTDSHNKGGTLVDKRIQRRDRMVTKAF